MLRGEGVRSCGQNLGEAEYVVALYQYMRLRGYPAERISILTTYNGQKALIQDVIERRCVGHPAFGRPLKARSLSCMRMRQPCIVFLSSCKPPPALIYQDNHAAAVLTRQCRARR
jgi:hypothetical protein